MIFIIDILLYDNEHIISFKNIANLKLVVPQGLFLEPIHALFSMEYYFTLYSSERAGIIVIIVIIVIAR